MKGDIEVGDRLVDGNAGGLYTLWEVTRISVDSGGMALVRVHEIGTHSFRTFSGVKAASFGRQPNPKAWRTP